MGPPGYPEDNNFNNYPRAFVVLFELMVVNNWNSLVDRFQVLVGTAWVRLFFISFHLVAVVFILSVLQALVIEVFQAESKVFEAEHSVDPLDKRVQDLFAVVNAEDAASPGYVRGGDDTELLTTARRATYTPEGPTVVRRGRRRLSILQQVFASDLISLEANRREAKRALQQRALDNPEDEGTSFFIETVRRTTVTLFDGGLRGSAFTRASIFGSPRPDANETDTGAAEAGVLAHDGAHDTSAPISISGGSPTPVRSAKGAVEMIRLHSGPAVEEGGRAGTGGQVALLESASESPP